MNFLKAILYVLLFGDLLFSVQYFIRWGSPISALWNVLFLFGILLSLSILGSRKKAKQEVLLLAVAVLVFSLSSLSGYVFYFYLTHLI